MVGRMAEECGSKAGRSRVGARRAAGGGKYGGCTRARIAGTQGSMHGQVHLAGEMWMRDPLGVQDNILDRVNNEEINRIRAVLHAIVAELGACPPGGLPIFLTRPRTPDMAFFCTSASVEDDEEQGACPRQDWSPRQSKSSRTQLR